MLLLGTWPLWMIPLAWIVVAVGIVWLLTAAAMIREQLQERRKR